MDRQSLHKKLGIPIPSTAEQEQLRQLMSWYTNKKFYRRTSSKSGKDIVSVYPPDAPCPVWDHDEWYADNWDAPSIEVSFEKPFFDQWKELQKIAPVVSLFSHKQENSIYCHDVEGLKNCYLCFDAVEDINVYYAYRTYNSTFCVDCLAVYDSELLYDCTYMYNCYNTSYSFQCRDVRDSMFLFNCANVQHCFMSSNLRNKEYYIFNKPHSKEEYEQFMKELDTKNYLKTMELKKQFRTMIAQTPVPPAFITQCENVTGNYLKTSESSTHAFESYDLKNCYNVFQCPRANDIASCFMCGLDAEQCYMCIATGISMKNALSTAYTWHGYNMEYCYLCIGSHDCFGCIGLRNKKYCIFNRQYEKEEYLALKEKLVAHMNSTGEYWQFFPEDLCPFKYEDTIAYDFFGDNKDHFQLEYESTSTNDSENTVRTCSVTGQPFKVIPQEFAFYQKQTLPLPHVCYEERYKQRTALVDNGFVEKDVHCKKTGTPLKTFFAHPEKWHIVTQEEYENGLN